MILYLDTSALVKLYIEEKSSEIVMTQVKSAETVATHIIAFVEARSAFARLYRESFLTEKQFDGLKASFSADWPNYLRMGSLPNVIERAANFSEAFSLRAYDSVHLASADHLQRSTGETICFGCFDRKLNQAAQTLGMIIFG